MWQVRLWHKASPISVFKIPKCVRKICTKVSGIRRLIGDYINSIQYTIQYIPINTIQHKREQLYWCQYISATSTQVEYGWQWQIVPRNQSSNRESILVMSRTDLRWRWPTEFLFHILTALDWMKLFLMKLNWTEVGKGYFGTGHFVSHDSC